MLRFSELKAINDPKYDELNINIFWTQIQKSDKMKQYFPNYKTNQTIDRKYLFSVLNSIDSDFVSNKFFDVQNHKIEGDKFIETK